MSPLRNLLDRIGQPPTRAAELRQLRRRLRAAANVAASDADRSAAVRARRVRQELSDAIGDPSACSSCAVGCEPAARVFPGGHCCSGRTEEIFADHELVGLALAGTRGRHLKAPRTEHAGCAFRGLRGCTLEAAHRPNQCLIYTCRELRRELSQRGDLVNVQGLIDELEAKLTQDARDVPSLVDLG